MVLEKKIRDISIYTLFAQLRPSRCMALSLFHAITGCDTVSHILGCGKKTAWSAWQSTTGLTGTLVALSSDPQQFSLQCHHMQTLERFVVVMYSNGCCLSRVSEIRLPSGKKTLEALPPTQATCISISAEQYCMPSFGIKQRQSTWTSLTSRTGVRTRTTVVDGCLSGQPSKTVAKHVPSFCSVAVSSHTEVTANVARLVCVVQVFANEKGGVSTMKTIDLFIDLLIEWQLS